MSPFLRRILPALFATLFAVQFPAAPVHAQGDPEVAAMGAALRLADRQSWDAAEAQARQAGRLGPTVLEWVRLRAGNGSFADYARFLRAHADWPGLGYLRGKGEATIAADTPAAEILAYFAKDLPTTATGSLAYQGALRAMGRTKEAEAEARRAWLELSYSASQQQAQLADYGRALAGMSAERLDRLLWRGRTGEAQQMLPLVGAGEAALGRARIALQTGAKGVDGLIAAVPRSLAGDAGLAHDRFDYRYDHGNSSGAEDLLLERSRSAKLLGDPAAWADRRARLARGEMAGGNARRAYALAAGAHLNPGPPVYAELQFLAGYIALQKLHDPKTALRHFEAFQKAVVTPISRSKADYWRGRAYDALHDIKSARAAYEAGAKNQTAFYGLLSAEKLGAALDPALLTQATFPDWRRAAFLDSDVLRAGLLLERAGARSLSRWFFVSLARRLDDVQLGELADMALAQDLPHVAVLVAKQAAGRGIILPKAYFPLTGLARDRLPVPTDLALAIARRESEFDETVVSPAGALGLMQVMPGTAQLMSRVAGVAYDRARLTTDAAYNAELGSTYLAQLIERFGPALTLVAAGYNAGPNRAAAWIEQLGDPRAPGVDPVDWIESVPFTETRDYIMRVAESYEIYRSKLAGRPLRINLMAELKGR